MRQPVLNTIRVALGAASLCLLFGAARAQSPVSTDQNVPAATARQQAAEIAKGDPARWYREDTTAAARLRTLQKEIGAALQESTGACKALKTAERAACIKEARSTYQQEMAGAKAQVALSN